MESKHSLVDHLNCVNSLCRLCGSRSKRVLKDKGRESTLCAKFSSDILSLYDVDVSKDKEGKHSKTICFLCRAKLIKLKMSEQQTGKKRDALDASHKTVDLWCEFNSSLSESECKTCNHFRLQSKGGRPSKKQSLAQKRKQEFQSDHEESLDISFNLDSTNTFTSTPAKTRRTVETETEELSFVDMAVSPFKTKILRPQHRLKGPLTPAEDAYFTKIVRIKLAESSDKTTVRCKTGGQPIILRKIAKPRKPTRTAHTPLKKKRALEMKKMRLDVSGGTDEDAVKQHGLELRTTCKAKKKIILEEAKCGQVSVSALQGAALRVKLGLSLTKYRVHKRFLKKLGVTFASEEKEKRAQLKAQCGEIQVEMRSLEFVNEKDNKKKELEPTPVANVKDLPTFVTELLDEYNKQGRLTWHNGSIPDDEVWVKIGGDHGGGSFKMMLQVTNLQKPNSKHNTCVIAIVECKDSAENLRRLLSPWRDQIASLQSMQWQDKRVRLFLFGDYEFLTKVYGLSGAQGIHPCLYCTASQLEIHAPPGSTEGNINQRSLNKNKRDYKKFCDAGKRLQTARLFCNVIRKPIIEIELEQVAPPYLHILLGIVKKHHDLLQKECHHLDKQLALSLARNAAEAPENTSSVFQHYIQQLKAVESKRRKLRRLQACAERKSPNAQRQILQVKEEIKNLKTKTAPLPLLSGPVTANLDQALQINHIYTQAYHSKAFVGNHCHKYLKPPVYESICDSVVEKTKDLTEDETLRVNAANIRTKFSDLNRLYSNIHQRISHQLPIAEESIGDIQQSIGLYMSYVRVQFPNIRVIPKQHLLEHHCVPFIRRWGIGLALFGEQGGEETHATVNLLQRKACFLYDQQKKLKLLLQEQHAIATPQFHDVFHLQLSGKRK